MSKWLFICLISDWLAFIDASSSAKRAALLAELIVVLALELYVAVVLSSSGRMRCAYAFLLKPDVVLALMFVPLSVGGVLAVLFVLARRGGERRIEVCV